MDHPPESKFQEPTDNKTRAGLGKFLRPNTPYDNFMEAQGIPIYRDIGVRRVQDLPRTPWKRMGGSTSWSNIACASPGSEWAAAGLSSSC